MQCRIVRQDIDSNTMFLRSRLLFDNANIIDAQLLSRAPVTRPAKLLRKMKVRGLLRRSWLTGV